MGKISEIAVTKPMPTITVCHCFDIVTNITKKYYRYLCENSIDDDCLE